MLSKYIIQLHLLPENLVHSAELTGTQQTVTLPDYYEQYWWRVSATVTGDHVTEWSKCLEFENYLKKDHSH
jgi:hypothetical protein